MLQGISYHSPYLKPLCCISDRQQSDEVTTPSQSLEANLDLVSLLSYDPSTWRGSTPRQYLDKCMRDQQVWGLILSWSIGPYDGYVTDNGLSSSSGAVVPYHYDSALSNQGQETIESCAHISYHWGSSLSPIKTRPSDTLDLALPSSQLPRPCYLVALRRTSESGQLLYTSTCILPHLGVQVKYRGRQITR